MGGALVMGRTRWKRARFLEKRSDWKSVEWTNRDRMCMIDASSFILSPLNRISIGERPFFRNRVLFQRN